MSKMSKMSKIFKPECKLTGQSKNFLCTLNNPQGLEDPEATFRRIVAAMEADWAAMQLEVGANGTPHFQLAFGVANQRRL